MKSCTLLVAAALSWSCTQGFVLPRAALVHNYNTATDASSLQYSAKDEEAEDEEKKRMELVRNLQNSYYKSSSNSDETPQVDNESGVMTNLPLWRVNWQELPGRSNVLNVHDPVYTNMFEIILNRPKGDWYFGHLYMPDGSKNLRSDEYAFQLKNWQDEAADGKRFEQRERTEVVGTLMRITDFRRLNDGRLCLLVQAMERFVVKDALQNLPYSIANVHVVPDYEELAEDASEEDAVKERGNAVKRSFAYHAYEYGTVSLPIPQTDYMTAEDVYGPWVQDVLPFVPYELDDGSLPSPQQRSMPLKKSSSTDQSLELRLLKDDILQTPAAHPEVFTSFEGKSSEELEDQLWNAIEAFCKATGAILPTELACLMPPDRSWYQDISQRVSSDYPAQRRQRRLSFNASFLLENTPMGKDLRQIWLETPSTHARLASVLERFELLISALLFGEFE